MIYLPKSQANCGSGGMLFTATRAQMAPPHGYRRPSVRTPFGALQVHMEEFLSHMYDTVHKVNDARVALCLLMCTGSLQDPVLTRERVWPGQRR
jgi:hypothetical protein